MTPERPSVEALVDALIEVARAMEHARKWGWWTTVELRLQDLAAARAAVLATLRPASDIEPIAKVTVSEDGPAQVMLYAPLPIGEHDLFPVPLDPQGANRLTAARAALRERVAGMEKDAARYQWLRDEWIINGKQGPRFDELDGLDAFGSGHVDDIVDAAIDAARAETAEQR